MRKSHSILVVDDDADIRDAIHDVLSDQGWDVISASDGLEAREQLHAGLRPCAILLDLMMPRMSGDEFLAWLRTEPATFADTPVVVLSAMGSTDLPGAQGSLRKPVQLRRLVETIQRFCPA